MNNVVSLNRFTDVRRAAWAKGLDLVRLSKAAMEEDAMYGASVRNNPNPLFHVCELRNGEALVLAELEGCAECIEQVMDTFEERKECEEAIRKECDEAMNARIELIPNHN